MSAISSVSSPTPCASGAVFLPNFTARYAGRIGDLRVHYRLAGAPRLPVVAVLGGISANAEVMARSDRAPGWWSEQVGPGLGVDTHCFRILSFNYLTRRGLPGTVCRAVSTDDQADALAGLIDALGIGVLHAVVGASYGAMVTLSFAARHGAHTRRLIAISGAHRAHPFATALRSLQRRIIRENGGNESGLALARALALATYLTPEFFAARFQVPPGFDAAGARFAVEDYLVQHGRKYAARADAGDYLDLSESLDLHDVAPEHITLPVTLIAADPDQLVPLVQMRELAARLSGPVRLHVIESAYGHDAFLKETAALRPLLREALQESRRHAA